MDKIKKLYKLGAIDIGTNAVRLGIFTIVEFNGQKKYLRDSFTRVPLRLGHDAFVYGELSPVTEHKLVNTMEAFKRLMEVNAVVDYKAIATSALRNAENQKHIVKEIKKKTGIKVKVIGGKAEADLTAKMDYSTFVTDKDVALLVDLGGGSTEISVRYKNKVIASRSFHIGTIRLLNDKVSDEEWKDMKKWVKENVKSRRNVVTLGFGGNVKAMFKLNLKSVSLGDSISLEEVQKVHDQLKDQKYTSRIFNYNLKPDRADVIIPACKVFLTVMKEAKSDQLYMPQRSVVEGIIESLV